MKYLRNILFLALLSAMSATVTASPLPCVDLRAHPMIGTRWMLAEGQLYADALSGTDKFHVLPIWAPTEVTVVCILLQEDQTYKVTFRLVDGTMGYRFVPTLETLALDLSPVTTPIPLF